MWPVQALYDALPKGVGDIPDDDRGRFLHLSRLPCQHAPRLAVEKVQEPDVVIFNRVTDATDKATLHRAVRMVNRRAQILFETVNGEVEPDTIVDERPLIWMQTWWR